MSNIPFSFRIALYGDSGVGKHSLLNSADAKPASNDDVEYFIIDTHQEIQKRKVILEVFHPVDKTIRYHAAFFLHDATDSSSFNYIQNIIKEFEKDRSSDCQIFVVGTKKDLTPDNSVRIKRSVYTTFFVNTNDRKEISDMIKKISNSLISSYQKDIMKICLDITKELKEHPSSYLIREPVKPENEMIEYYDVVKNPIFLSTIISRIENNEYQSVELWQQDVEQIKSDLQLYFGDNHFYKNIINEMFDVFKKILLKKLPPLGMNKIASKVNSKIKKVNALCDAPPPGMREMFPEGIVYTETDMKPFTDEDESLLVSEINNLSSTEDNLEVTQIMDYFNVKKRLNGKYYEVDINGLSDEAKMYLRSFVNLKVRAKKT